MPIELQMPVHRISQKEFHEIDQVVTGLSFDIHNEFGRLCDGSIYQAELLARCKKKGIEGHSEFEIKVSDNTFCKSYFIDLLLTNLAHEALINFRPTSVVHEFASTMLTEETRFKYSIEENAWQSLDSDSTQFRILMHNLLGEWGAFPDSQLYTEAITHFFGGEEQSIPAIPISESGRILGYQNVRLLNPETSFTVSATTKNIDYYGKHIKRFLNHTDLRAIQWVNFNHGIIEFRTVT
ncbi:hypothetical protein P4E94_06680 [Pontiellaceae bacterium B12219]|nr:hypothetical protein [Pontiellaceae bacterium B12219]